MNVKFPCHKTEATAEERDSLSSKQDPVYRPQTRDTPDVYSLFPTGLAVVIWGTTGHVAIWGTYGHVAIWGTSGHAAIWGTSEHAAIWGTSGHVAIWGTSEYVAIWVPLEMSRQIFTRPCLSPFVFFLA